MKKSSSNQREKIRAVLLTVFLSGASAILMWQTADELSFGSASKASAAIELHGDHSQSQKSSDSSIFAEFNDWTNEHLNEEFSDGDEHLRKGERLAVRRREVLKQLIESNPSDALEYAISPEIYNRIPRAVVQHLEKHISQKGDFLVSVSDEIRPEAEHSSNHGIRREAIFGETKYAAFVYGRKAAMTTKFNVPLRGIVLDETMAVAENPVRKIESSEHKTRNGDTEKIGKTGIAAEVGGEIVYFSNHEEFYKYTNDLAAWERQIAPARRNSNKESSQSSPWTEGAKTVLVIRVDFPDRIGEPVDQSGAPFTVARAQNVMNNSVNPFYLSNSYNKTSLQNPVVTPVVRMPQPQSFYNGFNLNTTMLADARAAARLAGFETNNYDFDIIAFGFTPNLSFSGSAIIGGKGLFLNGFFDFKTIAHELGHNYGLLHANLWRTTDGTVTGAGANVEYGDAFDLMGGGASQATHFSAGYKRRLDWLTDQNVQTVTTSGTYRIFAYDVVNAPTGIHALKIRKDNAKDYWIEFRQLFPTVPALANGALVRWDFAQQNSRQTQLLDMTPNTTSVGDAPLLVGNSFVDNASGITMTVLGKGNTTPESLDVRVELNRAIINGAAFDFDGDNKSDLAVFRPENGVWYLNQSTQGFRAIGWGMSTDKIVPAKFNPDRTTDLAVFRDGVWYVYNSFGGNPITVQFGQAGDIPVPADYDGDGAAEMAVYRPSNGTWYLWNWISQRFSAVQFGIAPDKPIPADYDGDGKTDLAVFRNGTWYIQRSQLGFTGIAFGQATDKPLPADYDGDGKADVAVFRPSDGTWYLQRSQLGFTGIQFGLESDLPVPADYDGDGKTDVAVFRAGTWYLQRSQAGFTGVAFGAATDKPLPNAFIP
jgi:hypothetical protein